MITREELLGKKGYWVAKLQNELFDVVLQYMEDHKLNRTKMADKLGVTKGYVTQVLNGDFDHRMSKFVELSLAVGKVPVIHFQDIDEFIKSENKSLQKGKVVPIKKAGRGPQKDQSEG